MPNSQLLTGPSHLVVKLEAIKGPSGPYPLYSFHDQESLAGCKILSDKEIGGFSKAHLDWIPPRSPSETVTPADNPNGHARFHGSISTQLPADRPNIMRSGFAAWRTWDRKPTIFGKSLWDVDPYSYLAMRIKSDGRSYLVNVQTESVEPTDIHQHRLFSKRPGEWETVLIKWNGFVRTNHGFPVEPQAEMLRQKVRTLGVGLTDRVEGPFDLRIERIWATNDPSEADSHEPSSSNEGELKTKGGKSIKW